MATNRQRRANAENARKSTGPRSAKGKRRTARNARTHGLTTPPPFENVLTYYRIILEDPEAEPGEDDTDMHQAALRLAECEAACNRALDAETQAVHDMAAYLRTKGEPDPLRLIEASGKLDLDDPAILAMMMLREDPDERDDETLAPEEDKTEEDKQQEAAHKDFMRGGLRILYSINRHNLARRRQRLERIAVYRQRAEGRRRRAFEAWFRVTGKNDNSKPKTRIS